MVGALGLSQGLSVSIWAVVRTRSLKTPRFWHFSCRICNFSWTEGLSVTVAVLGSLNQKAGVFPMAFEGSVHLCFLNCLRFSPPSPKVQRRTSRKMQPSDQISAGRPDVPVCAMSGEV